MKKLVNGKLVELTDEEKAVRLVEEAEAERERKQTEYIANRKAEYGTVEEQLEYLAENGVEAFKRRQAEIKKRHPKPKKEKK